VGPAPTTVTPTVDRTRPWEFDRIHRMWHEAGDGIVIRRTASELITHLHEEGVEIVDLRFCDLPGLMQHFSVPAHEITEKSLAEGFGFDGSSIRGFQTIDESDMLLLPDPNTAVIDPFRQHRTMNLNCFVRDPVTGEDYSRDPRNIARKAERHLETTGIADTAYFGPEAEFFIFDSARYGQDEHSSIHEVDSDEGAWRSAEPAVLGGGRSRGYQPRYKEGYFPVPPMDHLQDLRSEMILVLERCGVDVEVHHHEVATAGQAEIDMRFDTLLHMADKLMLYKYVTKNVAWQAGKTVTFMPKPLFQDNGSGMHTHQSLWKGGEPLFYAPDTYAEISDACRWYIGGLLTHAPSILAFAAPTTNSYKRLVPGFEAPVNLVYSQRNRSAAIRIPLYSRDPKTKRLEFRCPDPSCNPYLAFAAQLMAGLDGIAHKIDPPDPIDKDLYDLAPDQAATIAQVPASLEASLDALEADHDYLRAGDVFTDDVIETWIAFKRTSEIDPIRLRPHPYEFVLYYDI
jgi:glutamine synthetase